MPLLIDSVIYQALANDPVAPVDGQHWFNSAEGKHKRKKGGVVEEVPSISNSSVLKQSAAAKLAADISTTSSSFITILTINITTAAGFLEIFAAAGCSGTNNVRARARVTVDGVAVSVTNDHSHTSGNGAMSLAMIGRCAVTAAAHTVVFQYATDAGTLSVHAATDPDSEGATLLVNEVSG